MTLVRVKDAQPSHAAAMVRELEQHLNRVLGAGSAADSWTPATDVRETNDAYVVEADLPGFAKDAFRIEAAEDHLLLAGERKPADKAEGCRLHRGERRWGAFERRFRFPKGFQAEAVTAEYVDGVLRVTLPKRDEHKPRTIDVKFK